MGRGNRQGNNAFLEDTEHAHSTARSYLYDEWFIGRIMFMPALTEKLLKLLFSLDESLENRYREMMHMAVRAGNRAIAAFLMRDVFRYSQYGLSYTFYDVLTVTDHKHFEKVKKLQVSKRAHSYGGLAPVLCAAINPNPRVLDALLSANPTSVRMVDNESRTLAHYAAANESPDVLRYLIDEADELDFYL